VGVFGGLAVVALGGFCSGRSFFLLALGHDPRPQIGIRSLELETLASEPFHLGRRQGARLGEGGHVRLAWVSGLAVFGLQRARRSHPHVILNPVKDPPVKMSGRRHPRVGEAESRYVERLSSKRSEGDAVRSLRQ
jgi:hypothetical protein